MAIDGADGLGSTRVVSSTPLAPYRIQDWRRSAGAFAEGFLRLLYPPSCELCGDTIDDNRLCDTCRDALLSSANDRVCWRCATRLGPYAGNATDCNICRRESFAFERVVRLGLYDGVMALACRRSKEVRGNRLAVTMGELLWEQRSAAIREADADVVISIPLHWRRRWRRGFNQSDTLAEILAARMDRPFRPELLSRIRATVPQSGLTPWIRRLNPRNAFKARGPLGVEGKSVLLVDDILTTGATCHQAARALRAGGARRVVVAVVARAEGHFP